LAAVLSVALAERASAQMEYFNLDAGRPSRVEDAIPTPLYSLDIDPGSFVYERLTGGTNRFGAEPRFSYGALPFTEVELRLPSSGSIPRAGAARVRPPVSPASVSDFCARSMSRQRLGRR
jgi:hypothetical protein